MGVTHGEACEIKGFITLTGPRRGRHTRHTQGATWGESKGAVSAREVGSCERVNARGQVPLLWVEVEYTSKRH